MKKQLLLIVSLVAMNNLSASNEYVMDVVPTHQRDGIARRVVRRNPHAEIVDVSDFGRYSYAAPSQVPPVAIYPTVAIIPVRNLNPAPQHRRANSFDDLVILAGMNEMNMNDQQA